MSARIREVEGGVEMKEPKEVSVSLSKGVFSIELNTKDDDLIETVIHSLTEFVNRGYSIKIRQTYMDSLSDSTRIISKVISSSKQMDEWLDETKQLISVLRKGK